MEKGRATPLYTLLADGFYMERGKSLKLNVCENLNYYSDMDVKPEELKHVSYFGRSGQDGLSRSLRVKFHDPDLKNKLMSLKGKLHGTELYIREHITAHQLDIFIQAKIAPKNKFLFNVK